jgi:hypothetical protein
MFLPNIVDRHLALAPHYLPRRAQDPTAVSPQLPIASLDAPKITPLSRPGSPLPPSTHPRIPTPLLLADCGRRHYCIFPFYMDTRNT